MLVLVVGCGGAADAGGNAADAGPLATTKPLGDVLPAGPKSLDVFAEGDAVDVLVAVEDEAGLKLLHTHSTDGGATWRAATRVDAAGPTPHRPSFHSAPQIARVGEQLVAVWTTGGTGFMGRGPMASARSRDGGATWRSGPAPAAKPERGGQGFIDLASGPEGDLHLVWLGKRPDTIGNKGIYYARSGDHGASWSEPKAVDTHACECCATRLVTGSDGALYTLYRDIDPRDMSVAKLAAGDSWTRLGYAGAFAWAFDGCPHVGGGLLAVGPPEQRSLHAVVWTGETEAQGVYYVRSTDDGATWHPPQRVTDDPAIHADITGSAEFLVAAWDTRTDDGGAVYVAASRDDGAHWSAPVTISDAATKASLPRVVLTRGGVLMLWLEQRQDGDVLNARLLQDTDLDSN